MGTLLDDVTADAMKLSLRDRVKLSRRLAFSLDDCVETDVEVLWLAEAELRLKELRTGSVQGIDAAEAFRRAHDVLER